jgi:hypothetical protein
MRFAILLLLAPILSCREDPSAPASTGELAAEWQGSAQGGFRAAAQARWCPADSLLELFAVRNDTAIGFTLLPNDSLEAGTYSIFSTAVFVAFRPQASAAVRWLDLVELKGFEGTSGSVIVTEAGVRGVSGRFEASFKRTGNQDTIRVQGSFARVPVGQSTGQCGRSNRPGGG